MKKLIVRQFYFTDMKSLEKFEDWSPSIEAYPAEGEISVDNGYVKEGQYVCKTSAGNVYKLESDLLADLMQAEVVEFYEEGK